MNPPLSISLKNPYAAAHMNNEEQNGWAVLAGKAQKGDADAYRALLTAIVPVIRRSVRGKLPTPDAADDVVQDILLSVHKALHTYNPARPFLPWLSSIVSFRRADFLRQHYAMHDNTRISLDDPDTPNYLISEESSGSLKDIEEAFDDLPDKQKKVVELMKIKGYSAEEVAQKTGLSVSDVKVSAHRALAKLRDKLLAG